MRRTVYLITSILVLSGCATLSFAPPIVNQDRRLQFTRTQTFFGGVCDPKPIGRSGAVKPNVDGALLLINNYILTYRCQRDRAAEGRQFFEVPSFLGAAAAGTALALGAAPVVAIVAGAGTTTLEHTNKYYAPQAKAQVLADGLQAMLCIQTAAVGVDPYVLEAVSNAQDVKSGATTNDDLKKDENAKRIQSQEQAANPPEGKKPTTQPPADDTGAAAFISVSYGRQYYELIRSALFSVEQVVGQRLSASGTPFDAAGVIAEIEKLNKQEADEGAGGKDTGAADNGKPKPKPATAGQQNEKEDAEKKIGKDVQKATGADQGLAGADSAQGKLAAIDPRKVGRTIIKLDQLHTKLQKCVVSAKV